MNHHDSSWVGTHASAVMRVQATRPRAKIVGVDLRENSIRVLGGEERAIDLVEQLMEAIEGQGVSDELAGQSGCRV